MARYIGPKNKLARKVGEDLSLKTNALKSTRRLSVRPGQHGARARRKLSGYGVQLREKQKIKFLYGVLEKQLRRLYEEASKNPTATGAALLGLLERRLDNVVFRLGFAPTRAAARQFVNHGHLMVNGIRVSVPSYRVNVGDVVVLRPKATAMPVVAELLKEAQPNMAQWLERKAAAGTVTRLPERSDILEKVDEQLLVEYYSR